MAFQMIPPRVSSSPPPLDSLPGVTCTDDDDEEEFGSFSTHNTFDITGLSDKLPPTPESSPSKFPNDAGLRELKTSSVAPEVGQDDAKNKKDVDVDGVSHGETQASSCPSAKDKSSSECSRSSYVPDVNGELTSSSETREDSGEFSDFTNFTAFADVNDPPVLIVRDESDGVNSSQELECNVVSEVASASPINSDNSFSMVATPPPLDHVADSVVIDDEFSRISPNPPNAAADDDEFGDFATCTFEGTKCSSLTVSDSGEGGLTSCSNNIKDVEGTVKSASDNSGVQEGHLEENKINNIVTVAQKVDEPDIENVKSSTSENLHSSHENKHIPSLSGDDIAHNVVTDRTSNLESLNSVKDDIEEWGSFDGGFKTFVQNDNTDYQKESEGTVFSPSSKETITGKDTSSDLSVPNVVAKDKAEPASEDSNDVQSAVAQSVDVRDTQVSEQQSHSDKQSVSRDNFDDLIESEVSACTNSKDVSSSFRTDKNVTNSDVPHRGIDSARISENKSTFNDYAHGVECQYDSDFGEFDKAGDDDDDDLDFDDIRDQVCKGTFGLDEPADDFDDFGEFSEFGGAHTLGVEDAEAEEFGDFGTPSAVTEEANKFGEFSSGGPKDEFGDFTSPGCQVPEGEVHLESDTQDEFGDFASQQDIETYSATSKPSWTVNFPSASYQDRPVLRKLESLVLKWIPRDPAMNLSSESQENHSVPTLFQSVEDDAFVWRQLENLESSAALTLSWGSTQAQTLYLSSVNVDARNILFGQKWSSSVPLFAQTLSFSPLTPAKPPENGSALDGGGGGGGGGGNRGSVTPPILASAITPKFSSSFSKDEVQVEIPPINENTSEEQIPPAKFDWTSSGLTNPLEGPAYNSSLFDMDLLLSNSNIGKGATNALLASLEREFLSEGGEKGACNRIKSPPGPSPLVQQILGSGMIRTPSSATPLQSLSSDLREMVEHLPDIGFMRSRVLMFPIRGEEGEN